MIYTMGLKTDKITDTGLPEYTFRNAQNATLIMIMKYACLLR